MNGDICYLTIENQIHSRSQEEKVYAYYQRVVNNHYIEYSKHKIEERRECIIIYIATVGLYVILVNELSNTV